MELKIDVAVIDNERQDTSTRSIDLTPELLETIIHPTNADSAQDVLVSIVSMIYGTIKSSVGINRGQVGVKRSSVYSAIDNYIDKTNEPALVDVAIDMPTAKSQPVVKPQPMATVHADADEHKKVLNDTMMDALMSRMGKKTPSVEPQSTTTQSVEPKTTTQFVEPRTTVRSVESKPTTTQSVEPKPTTTQSVEPRTTVRSVEPKPTKVISDDDLVFEELNNIQIDSPLLHANLGNKNEAVKPKVTQTAPKPKVVQQPITQDHDELNAMTNKLSDLLSVTQKVPTPVTHTTDLSNDALERELAGVSDKPSVHDALRTKGLDDVLTNLHQKKPGRSLDNDSDNSSDGEFNQDFNNYI